MGDENSIVKLGDLTKPATVLIEKISDAVGGVFKPYQIVRVAKAEVEAELIRADAQIQITDLHRRAMHRFVEEEAMHQLNIESITNLALPSLTEKASPQGMENDWVTNLFDKCRIVSDKKMQQIWSRILAGEANDPGTFAKRTVNLIADLDKSDAELFTRLCGFGWMLNEDFCPLVLDYRQADPYNIKGIDRMSLMNLEELGLIQFNGISVWSIGELPKNLTVFYFGSPLELMLPLDNDNKLSIGSVLLTRAGEQLASVCGATPINGFFEYVYDKWASQSLISPSQMRN
jgi:Protein of unknown function (DUF2806)